MLPRSEHTAWECFVLCIYSLIFRVIGYFHRKTFTPFVDQFEETIDATEEEWELERKSDKRESLVFTGSTWDGSSWIVLDVHSTVSSLSSTVLLCTKGRQLINTGNVAKQNLSSRETFSIGPLHLELRDPFRRWRINFKGVMKDIATGEEVFVSLGGWWKPTSDVRSFFSNATPHSLELSILDRPLNFIEHSKVFRKLLLSSDLSQWGQISCEVAIGSEESEELRLRGIRTRRELCEKSLNETQLSLYLEDGNRLLWSQRAFLLFTTTHGFLSKANLSVLPMHVRNRNSVLDANDQDMIHLEADNHLTLSKTTSPTSISYVRQNGEMITVTVQGMQHLLWRGTGLTIQTKAPLHFAKEPVFLTTPEYVAVGAEKTRLVLPFTHRACQDKSLTGGKGANLARLTAVADKFVVPRGLVVTTTAYEKHLEENPEIKKIVDSLSTKKLTTEEILQLGDQIGQLFKKSSLSTELLDELTSQITIEIASGSTVAVRSSAVGEDGADLSSAGQLESFLNTSIDDIPAKILECWSSNFRQEVINYRRQYGQPVNPPMAVVVQQMVSDGIAGVLFTCDPVRGDTSRVVINAIQGEGEDIVSGAVTPDQIVLVKATAEPISQPTPCCLSLPAQKHLLHVGVFLEHVFGAPQDIEFVAVKLSSGDDGAVRVHIVQSRDVTNRERESDFELLEEFTDATLTDKEIFTTANVGEVMPEPMTPLDHSYLFMLDKVVSATARTHRWFRVSRHCRSVLFGYKNKIFFCLCELMLPVWEILKKDRIGEIAMGGQPLINDGMLDMGRERFGKLHPLFPIMRLAYSLKVMLYTSKKELRKAKDNELFVRSFIVGDSAFERVRNTLHQRKILCRLDQNHTTESMFSTFMYVFVAMLIRGKEDGEFTQEMMSDVATIFSNGHGSGAISGDVPEALKNLARALYEDGITVSDLEEKGISAIKVGRQSGPLLKSFFETHGHRGQGELYIKATTWKEQPDFLLRTLMTILSTYDPTKKNEDVTMGIEEILDSLKSKPMGVRRRILKYLIGETHRGVASREFAKNLLVKGISHIRENIKVAAQMMVDEGYLPDTDIIYYFTHQELFDFVQHRSARLISRAMKRRRIAPLFHGHQYDYVYWGNIKEIDAGRSEDVHRESSLTGTTVCEGRVVAKARVAKTLEEAKQTQPGEILITRYTDICWSPFFPIIRGIVTEIGGLLSHGAVVAREYGLPSLIAVQHATDTFKTGDLVELNATKGIISKVTE